MKYRGVEIIFNPELGKPEDDGTVYRVSRETAERAGSTKRHFDEVSKDWADVATKGWVVL